MKILFVQLPVPTLVPVKNIGNHLLASSSIINHLRFNKCNIENISVLPQSISSRAGDSQIINEICNYSPDIVAFTCTVWNIERTIFISECLKKSLSNVKIWYGGPEVATDSYFVKDNNSVFDLAVEGEGEIIFQKLIRGEKPETFGNIILPDARNTKSFSALKLPDLASIHDPFIKGYAHMESDHVLVAEFSRGCRYGCGFCRYHDGLKDKHYAIRPDEQIIDLLNWAKGHNVKEIFLLDPSFEQRPDIKQFLYLLSIHNQNPCIPIFAELRAEYVDHELSNLLFAAGVRHIETGLQTTSNKALANVGRSFNENKFTQGIINLQSVGIKVRTDIMIGLPGDNPGSLDITSKFLMNIGLNKSAQIFRTQVLPGTPLRSLSEKLGILYENKPPYQILSTPDWNYDDLENSIEKIESILDISCAPEEHPYFIMNDKDCFYNRYVDDESNATIAYAFDCTNEAGRSKLDKEMFSNASFTTSILIKMNSLQFYSLIYSAIERFLKLNPFSSVSIILQIPANFALDPIDSLDTLLNTHSYSNYLSRLFPTTYSNRPNRRIFVGLELQEPTKYSLPWLEDIRLISEIVWIDIKPYFDCIHDFETYPYIDDVDYCYLHISKEDLDSVISVFSKLSTMSRAYQYLLSDIKLQWDFIEYLDSL